MVLANVGSRGLAGDARDLRLVLFQRRGERRLEMLRLDLARTAAGRTASTSAQQRIARRSAGALAGALRRPRLAALRLGLLAAGFALHVAGLARLRRASSAAPVLSASALRRATGLSRRRQRAMRRDKKMGRRGDRPIMLLGSKSDHGKAAA